MFHLCGSDPNEAQAERFKQRLTLVVCLSLGFVNTSVHFHNKPFRRAEKIHHKGSDRLLPAESPAFQLFKSYRFP